MEIGDLRLEIIAWLLEVKHKTSIDANITAKVYKAHCYTQSVSSLSRNTSSNCSNGYGN